VGPCLHLLLHIYILQRVQIHSSLREENLLRRWKEEEKKKERA